MLVRVTRETEIIYKEIYYEESAHGILEAEKSHDVWSTGWRPRKASPSVSPEAGPLVV